MPLLADRIIPGLYSFAAVCVITAIVFSFARGAERHTAVQAEWLEFRDRYCGPVTLHDAGSLIAPRVWQVECGPVVYRWTGSRDRYPAGWSP